ncbi:MAG: alpha/beta hydrolase [Arthrobacter sp.]|uniref:alpha/beta hydrolase n=1 Tax=Arthrobacter sp. TaxID=1667 RepID=UPI003470BD28
MDRWNRPRVSGPGKPSGGAESAALPGALAAGEETAPGAARETPPGAAGPAPAQSPPSAGDSPGEPLPAGVIASDAGPSPQGYAIDTAPGQWLDDPLGAGFAYTTLAQGEDEEGPVCATLVRHLPPRPAREPWRDALLDLAGGLRRAGGALRGPPDGEAPVPVVLSVHGWTDYFYNAELARFWSGRGYRFYALELRRYGRSLRAWQTPGFVQDLREYDDDIDAALSAIRADVGRLGDVVCVAHSTGGLVASLWADRHPGAFSALVLNAPWLELQGSSLVRAAAAGLLDPVARRRPRAKLKLPEVDHYWQSLSAEAHGEWALHPLWRPRHSFPVTVGWMTAVLAGHAAVSRGLDIRAPILVLTSDRTQLGTQFDPAMLTADAVIDVEVVRQRALKLGRAVTVVRVENAMHDLFASAAPARSAAYDAVTRWSEGYLPPPRRGR